MTPSSPRPSCNFADIPINNCSSGPTNSDQNTYSQNTMTIVFTHKSNLHFSVFSLPLLPLQFLLLFLTHSLGKPSVIEFPHNFVKNHDNRLGYNIFLFFFHKAILGVNFKTTFDASHILLSLLFFVCLCVAF